MCLGQKLEARILFNFPESLARIFQRCELELSIHVYRGLIQGMWRVDRQLPVLFDYKI